MYTQIKDINEEHIDKHLSLRGWLSSLHEKKHITFFHIHDGTRRDDGQVPTLQCIYETKGQVEPLKLSVHQYVILTGKLVKSPKDKQPWELQVTTISTGGDIRDKSVDTLWLPLTFQSSDLSLGLFRQPHMLQYRMRERVFQTIFYLRSYLEQEVWKFFMTKGFIRTDPNIITCSDCEGAGELFYLRPSGETVGAEVPFFGKSSLQPALTVSSQLPLEFLCAETVGVWTLNPSFRAEKSSTQRHLSEFRHLEWESHTLGSLSSLMDFNEEIVRYLITSLLSQTHLLRQLDDDLRRLGITHLQTTEERLRAYIKSEKWLRISYTDALALCHQAENSTKILEIWKEDKLPEWGDDLGTMCERYLTDYIYKQPIIIHSYPRDLKSFYMKQNPVSDTGRYTVQGCDLLMPGMGELIGSSVREESYDTLLKEMERRKMDKKGFEWYIELRRNGSFPHGGAGLGFDRLVQACLFEAGSIRDVTPIPVAYQYLHF